MHHHLDVVGINFENKDGSSRAEFIRKRMSDDWCDKRITIELKREKGNRNDKNAIAVYANVKVFLGYDVLKIGYLDRDDARDIAPQMDRSGIISNLSLEDVWIPDYAHVTPRVRLSFDSSWNQKDVERLREEKRIREREKRQSKKLEKQNQGEHFSQTEEKVSIQNLQKKSNECNEEKEKSSWWLFFILWIVISAVIYNWMK